MTDAQMESVASLLGAARARYLDAPSQAGEDEILRLEIEQRKAELRAEAAEHAARKAREEAERADRAAALAEREEILGERAGIRRQLREQVAAIGAIVEQLHAAVSAIETAANSDAELVQRLNAASARARVSGERARAVDLEEIRIAVGISLSRAGWLEPRIPHDVNFAEFQKAGSAISSIGTPYELRERLRLALLAHSHCLGDVELSRWLDLQPQPHEATAIEVTKRWHRAERLLDTLEDTTS